MMLNYTVAYFYSQGNPFGIVFSNIIASLAINKNACFVYIG